MAVLSEEMEMVLVEEVKEELKVIEGQIVEMEPEEVEIEEEIDVEDVEVIEEVDVEEIDEITVIEIGKEVIQLIEKREL